LILTFWEKRVELELVGSQKIVGGGPTENRITCFWGQGGGHFLLRGPYEPGNPREGSLREARLVKGRARRAQSRWKKKE